MRKTKFLLIILMFLLVMLTGCSKEVNEEKWIKAFSEESFKNCQIVITNDSTEQIKTVEYAGNTVHLHIGYYNRGQLISETERYYTTDSLKVMWQYWYDTFEKKWYRAKTTVQNPETILSDVFNDFINKYSLFEYNASDENYKRIVGNEMTIVTFNKNKVSKIEIINNYNSSNSNTITYEFVGYGTTQITLPEV